MLPQALEIIFEVQRKRSNEKITRKEINFPIYKTHFPFFSFFLWTLQLLDLVTFLFLIHLKNLKCYINTT